LNTTSAATYKALATLATIVAELGDCRRFGRQFVGDKLLNLPNFTENGDIRRIRRLSPFSPTVAEFGDKLSPFPATIVAEIGDYSRQCGQSLRQRFQCRCGMTWKNGVAVVEM